MDVSFENSHKVMTSGKRRLPHSRAEEDFYEGSKQRQRLGGEECTSNMSSHQSAWNRNDTSGSKLHSLSCGLNKAGDLEQSIIKGVEQMDLQQHSSPLKLCLSNSLDGEHFCAVKCGGNKYDSNPCISSKENKTMRKLKKVNFKNRAENLDQDPFSKQSPPGVSTAHLGHQNHLLHGTHQMDLGRDKPWDPKSLNADSLAHRENISSAGTPPDANSFASFEDLGSQMTDEVFVKSNDSRRKRDVTDEEREDRIMKWLCTVRSMTETRGLFNVRLS